MTSNSASRQLTLPIRLVIYCLISGLMVLELQLYLPHNLQPFVALLIGAVIVLLLIVYQVGTEHDRNKRERLRPQYTVHVAEPMLIGEHDIKNLSFLFSQKPINPVSKVIEVRLVARRAKVYQILPFSLACLIGITSCVVAVYSHHSLYLILAVEVWVLSCGVAWLWWSTWYYIVDNDTVMVLRIYPSWLFWFPDIRSSLLLKDCATVHLTRSFWARLTGHGSIDSDSSAENDKVFNHVWGIPHEEVAFAITLDAITEAGYRVVVEDPPTPQANRDPTIPTMDQTRPIMRTHKPKGSQQQPYRPY